MEGAFLLAGVVLLAAVFVVVLVIVPRRSRGETLTRRRDPAPVLDAEPDDVVLVPLPTQAGDRALVLGSENALGLLDSAGLTSRPSAGRAGPIPKMVRAAANAGGLAASRRAEVGVRSGRIVALTEESQRALERGTPVYDSAKNMLGIVKGDQGKIAHVMRFDRAGAQAVVASNVATLAVTAALSQQLEQIAEQLEEIGEKLDGLVRDQDRTRMAEVVAANQKLGEIADNVRRRGIDDADRGDLSSLKLPVAARQIEAEFKFDEVLSDQLDQMSRARRLDKLRELADKERLDYWLAVRVQADLAQTRVDLLTLLYEQQRHPETAAALNADVHQKIRERQRRLADVGEAIRRLADPDGRRWRDSFQQISRLRLQREQDRLGELLDSHGDVFRDPDGAPYAVLFEAESSQHVLPANTGPAPRKDG